MPLDRRPKRSSRCLERADRRLYHVLAGADELGQSRIARTRTSLLLHPAVRVASSVALLLPNPAVRVGALSCATSSAAHCNDSSPAQMSSGGHDS